MRPPWRLAINSLSARRSRSALLIATVALAAGLIAAVGCAMASLHKGIRARVEATVGAADVRLQRIGRNSFDVAVLDQVRGWPEVKLVVGRAQAALPLKNQRTGKDAVTVGSGLMLEAEYTLRPPAIVEGRELRESGEIVLDTQAAMRLEAQIGDRLDVVRFGDPVSLMVVGIVKHPGIGAGIAAQEESSVTIGQLADLSRDGDEPPSTKIREADIVLHEPDLSTEFAERRVSQLERGLTLRPTAKVTSGLNKNLESSQLGMVVASLMAFLASSFIIMTGLTTNVNERSRELAVMRCIGGSRAQLAEAQLAVGLLVGLLGALVGVPLGIGGAYVMTRLFPDQLPAGFAINPLGLVTSIGGAMLAGLIGAAWPAFRAARTSPLEALAVRAHSASIRGIVVCTAVGLFLAAVHFSILALGPTPDFVFWGDLIVGIPSLFTGYFLLSVPVMLCAAFVVSPLLSRMLALPRGVLFRGVRATPYRFGFTSGAMMLGLALMIAIWTNGQAVMRDWLGQLRFPDAFVAGISLTEKTRERLAALPFVRESCAVTMQNFRTDAFGVSAFDNTQTAFIGFDPAPFFRTTDLTWLEGDSAAAQAALAAGGAVLVSREFKVARGMGIGDTLTLRYEEKAYPFRVVGVVASPGLDIAGKFFDIGEQYLDQSVNAVFGSRNDLVTLFGNTSINLIQFTVDPAVNDDHVIRELRRAGGFEVLQAGSGRTIKAEIGGYLNGSLLVFSIVAVAAMLVAGLGVANLIVAGIQARQFEFGVLRAIGGHRALLTRLVIGEALLIALAACIVGTLMGLHAAWGGTRMYEIMLGLVLRVRPPVGAIAFGWAAVTLITLGAATPAAIALSRKHPRELLGAMKG